MVIKIEPNGNITTLYSDKKRPLLDKLGNLSVERASNVEFSDGLWYVTKDNNRLIEEGFLLRELAIRAEVRLLEEL
jgi:hypothetical protein